MDTGFSTTQRTDAPAAWWRQWRLRDYSWQGLARLPGRDGRTLQNEWRDEAAALITEPGTDRQWTRFHYPLFFTDGSLSPKVSWSGAEWREVYARLRTRLALSGPDRPCRMNGMVLDGLDESEEALDPDVTMQLWLSARDACFLRRVQARNLRFGLADFTGAWLGGGSDFTGAVLPPAVSVPSAQVATPPPVAPIALKPPSTLPRPIVTEPETVQVAAEPERPRRRLGLWLAAGAAVLGVAAMVLLKTL